MNALLDTLDNREGIVLFAIYFSVCVSTCAFVSASNLQGQ